MAWVTWAPSDWRGAYKVDLAGQDIISVAVSVCDVNLIGVVKFYGRARGQTDFRA